ncbi:MAG: cytochrome c3 family protein [Deltaproteobacteria bacterium]|nr:cytochrome c3 family protein [Deltaproteobacteria bacterium]
MVKVFIKYIFISFLFIIPTIFFTGTKTDSALPAQEIKQSVFTDKQIWGLKYDKYGIIDPTPDMQMLRLLPRDSYNFIDWAKALSDDIIAPLDSIHEREDNTIQFSKDIIIKSKMDFMPDVLFPHNVHNFWLNCSACHPKLFETQAGATPISMAAIWKGQFCGRCHDKVAFPLRNCFRCHSVPKETKKQPPQQDVK